jgi:uncharacterized protein with von Willebrand factor type A (vWA) domain
MMWYINCSNLDYCRCDGEPSCKDGSDEDSELCCTAKLNTVIILDGSGSVRKPNFDLAKHFVVKLAKTVTTNEESEFGFIVYSDNVKIVIPLGKPDDIEARILAAGYPRGGTNTAEAIIAAYDQLKNRPDPRAMIVLTDGSSNNRRYLKCGF